MIGKIFPFLLWFRGYESKTFQADFVAGITVALVLIPQSMAYAQLAGLPAYYGMYAAFLPPMIASLFGSSRQLATGPVAVVSLMTATALEPLATAGSTPFIAYAVMLALAVGLFQLLLGVLRFGLVVNFLSHPVINGFTNAAAIIIATSQLAKIFGVEVEKAERHYESVILVLESAWHSTHWPTFSMAVLALTIIVGCKRVYPRVPGILVAVVVTTMISWVSGFERNISVKLADIDAPEAQVLIREFNEGINDVHNLGQKRSSVSKRLSEMDSMVGEPDREVLLALRHEQALLTFHLDKANQKVSEIRTQLRNFRFAATENPDGTLNYFESNSLSGETEAGSPLYRLKLGSVALDENALILAGGGAVIGTIPQRIPPLHLPGIEMRVLRQLLPYAVIIALVGFMEAISIAKAMAAKTGQKLDPNQELIGQGLANIVSAVSGSYPVSGSFSRSAVNLQAGAITGLANIFSSLVVLVTLLFLTPLLYHLPQAVLACVIMMAVVGLVNIKAFVHTWKTQRYEGVISVITFGATLVFAPHLDKGILVGVVLSASLFFYGRMRPKVAALSMDQDGMLQCATNNQLQLCRHIAAVRFDGSLFFANASYLDEQIFLIRSSTPDLQHILLVAEGINDMDSSGDEALSLLKQRLHVAEVGLSLCKVNDKVLAVMKRSGLLEKIGTENIYASVTTALDRIIGQIHEGATGKPCGSCPLTNHVPIAASGAQGRKNTLYDDNKSIAAVIVPNSFRSLRNMLNALVGALATSA